VANRTGSVSVGIFAAAPIGPKQAADLRGYRPPNRVSHMLIAGGHRRIRRSRF
jgi:hypothetical protein